MIVPGLYPSEMTQNSIASYNRFSGVEGHEQCFTDARELTADRVPAERSGSEEDFAGAILFLASRAGEICFFKARPSVQDIY